MDIELFIESFRHDVGVDDSLTVAPSAEAFDCCRSLFDKSGGVIAGLEQEYTLAKQSIRSTAGFLQTAGSIWPEVVDRMRFIVCLYLLQRRPARKEEMSMLYLHGITCTSDPGCPYERVYDIIISSNYGHASIL